MKTASAALIALLASRQFVMADTYTLTMVNGVVSRIGSGDHAVVHGGNQFPCSIQAKRSEIAWRLGIEVDTSEITLYPSATDLVSGYSWYRAASLGLLDAMEVLIERVYAAVWRYPVTTAVGAVHLFSGRLAGLDGGMSTGLALSVNSDLERLNTMMPRNLYQPGCLHTLFNAGCGLVRSEWTTAGTVGSGATTRVVPVPGTGKADGYFDQGVLTMAGGLIRRTIKKWADDTATLIVPLHDAPDEDDAVSLIAGCDKTRATCENKFSNLANHRAFPFVPAPEASLSV